MDISSSIDPFLGCWIVGLFALSDHYEYTLMNTHVQVS